jgi:hypothetical protein
MKNVIDNINSKDFNKLRRITYIKAQQKYKYHDF